MARLLGVYVAVWCVAYGAMAMDCCAQVPLSQLTVVAYNKAEPTSQALAKFYAQQRGIPSDHVIGLDCPVEDEISREDFDATIAQPLREEFKSKRWWTIHADPEGKERVTASSIRFLAIIKGIPLKIRPTANTAPGDQGGPGPIASHNESSVDSELSLVAFNPHPISGLIPNPYFQSYRAIRDFENPNILLVCRLDGPTPG